MMMKMVEPYMSIMSPGSSTPTLTRLGGGIDRADDDRRARRRGRSPRPRARVTVPAMSVVQARLGQAVEVDDVRGERVAPGELVDERRAD